MLVSRTSIPTAEQKQLASVKGVGVEVLTDDPELRKEAKSCAAFMHEDTIVRLEEIISSWPRLKRIIGLVLCFKKLLSCIRESRSAKKLAHTKQLCSTPLDLEGIKMVKKEIIRSV